VAQNSFPSAVPLQTTVLAKPVLLYNHQSPSASVFRALSSTFDMTMCPHLCFFGADLLVSYALSIKVLAPSELSLAPSSVSTMLLHTEYVVVVVTLFDPNHRTQFASLQPVVAALRKLANVQVLVSSDFICPSQLVSR
jgi:hypothetical protein